MAADTKWTSITEEYLQELYKTIATLQQRVKDLEEAKEKQEWADRPLERDTSPRGA